MCKYTLCKCLIYCRTNNKMSFFYFQISEAMLSTNIPVNQFIKELERSVMENLENLVKSLSCPELQEKTCHTSPFFKKFFYCHCFLHKLGMTIFQRYINKKHQIPKSILHWTFTAHSRFIWHTEFYMCNHSLKHLFFKILIKKEVCRVSCRGGCPRLAGGCA